MRVSILCILCLLSTVTPVQAWNATGHKIIASIAFRQLTVAEQSGVIDLLKRHPRYMQDFGDEMPTDVRSADLSTQNEWLFQQAAVWPDLVRGGPPEKRAFNRGEWHYINLPLYLDGAAREELVERLSVNLAMQPQENATPDTPRMNAVQVIRFAQREIPDKQASPEDRSVLLAWLFHNSGDIHQPLHSTAMFSKRLFPEGDRGGNSVKTVQAGNLHSLWDQFPGQADGYREARNRAITVVNDSRLAKIGAEAAGALDAEVWMSESHDLAKSAVYESQIRVALKRMEDGGGTVEPIQLSNDYLKVGGRVAEQRVVQAGYRLGALLKTLIAE
jgi:hypothetical protein